MKLLAVVATLGVLAQAGSLSEQPSEAQDFLSILSLVQRKQALFNTNSERLTDWHYVPRSRPGVNWSALNARQKAAAHNLLRASLSKAGYDKVEALRVLEADL